MAGLGNLPTNDWNYLQQQLSRLAQAWGAGDPGDLEQFLPPPNDLLRAITLQELIITDLEMRWRNGQHVGLDYYVDKYPELGTLHDLPATVICEEYLVRQRNGDAPQLSTYQRRFPRQFSELEVLLRQQTPSAPPAAPSPALSPFSGTGTMPNPYGSINGYKLIKRLASGAFADVYEAEAPGGRHVALKIIRQPLTNEEARREEESLKLFNQLSNPCLVNVHAYWIHEDHLYIAMDLADCTLRDRLQECREAGVPENGICGIRPQELLAYFRDAAEALDYLHSEHVLHRDVKPANILLFRAKRVRSSGSGSGEISRAIAKLADFGLAKLVESQRVVASGGGTPAYMAPETCRQSQTSPQSDQYGLAASYAELRLGRPLFPHTNQLALTEAILYETPDLAPLSLGEQRVLLRALAKNPDERFPTCQMFVSALEEAVPLAAKPSSGSAQMVGPYRLVRLLGGGVRGELWEVVAPDGGHVALTVIRNLPWEYAAAECRNLQFLRGIQHENLARLYDVFLLDPQDLVLSPESNPPSDPALMSLCLVRELLPETLGQRLERSEKGISTRELLPLLSQAAEGLDALRGPHAVETAPSAAEGAAEPKRTWFGSWSREKQTAATGPSETVTVIHSAICPRTLLVNGPTLKVGDFALAKLLHSAHGSLSGDETVLHGYVAPELYQYTGHANSDQYSLAITYVELRTGHLPFKSTSNAERMAQQREGNLNLKRLPDAERDVIKKATALDPAQRYPSCKALLAALDEACNPSVIRPTAKPTPPKEKPPAAPPVRTAPPLTPVTHRTEDSGSFVMPRVAVAPTKPVVATPPAPIAFDETIKPAHGGFQGMQDIQDTHISAELARPQTPRESEPVPPPPRATPAVEEAKPRRSSRTVPTIPSKKKGWTTGQRMLATVGLVAGAVVLVVGLMVVVNSIVKPQPDDMEATINTLIQNEKCVEAFQAITNAATDKKLSSDQIERLLEKNRTAWVKPTEQRFERKEYQTAWSELESIIALDAGNAAAKELLGKVNQLLLVQTPKKPDDPIVVIPPVPTKTDIKPLLSRLVTEEGSIALKTADEILGHEPNNMAAKAHQAALQGMVSIHEGKVPPKQALRSWLTDLQKHDATTRMKELLEAVANQADQSTMYARQVVMDLPESKDVPQECRGYVRYLVAKAADLTGAADELMRLFAEEGNAPHVLAASGRRVWAAKVFVDAAAGLRKKSNLVAPFGDAAGATRAATWLKRAYSLQGDPKNSAAAPLRFDLALAVAYQEQPDLPSARPHLNDLIKQLSEKTVAFEGSERVLLLITHARCQDASTPLGQTAAIKSYAAAVEHIEKNKERVGIQDDIVYRSVVDPALRLVKKLPTPLKEASHEKPCAIVWASYANLLANNLDAYWDGLTKEKAMQAVVAAWDQACQIDPKNFNLLARRIEAYLAFVPMPNFETLANDARQLIGLDRQSSIGYYLLVKLLVKDLGANQHTDKKKARWLEVIQFADAGLAALDKEVNPPAERTNHFNEWRGAASNSLREILQTEGYALLRKRAYKEAVGLARELGSFDRIAAARIEGYVLHADKKWLDAQLVFGAALSEANEPANDWHLKLRQEYVNLLIAPGANEILLPRAKGSPEVSLGLIAGHISYWQFLVLAGQAEALVGIINDTVDPLSKGPAYGAAGAAWAHAEDMLPLACKVERKRASIKASAYLDQALTHTPTHKLGPIWLETYADVVNGLRLSDPMNIAVLEHCRKAAARLQEALKVGAPTPPPEDRRPRLNELLKKLSSAVK